MLGRPPVLGAGAAQDAAPLAGDVLPRHALGLVAVETAVVLVDRGTLLVDVADLAEGRRETRRKICGKTTCTRGILC